MKPLTNCLLFTTLTVLLLRTVLGQSNHKYDMVSTPENRFPQLQRVIARLPGGVSSPAPLMSPWSFHNEGLEAARPARTVGDTGQSQNAGVPAAPREYRAYPTLATSKLQPLDREPSVDSRSGGSRTPEPAPQISSYSQLKWDTLGRRRTLDAYRNAHMSGNSHRLPPPNQDDYNRALQHALLMTNKAVCRVPRPKVINVKDVHPYPGKTYNPSCTELHRCGDDTACCRAETDSCQPSRTQVVELHFNTLVQTSGRGIVVEKLKFVNHTECSCRNKYENEMPRDMDAGPPKMSYSGYYPGPYAGPRTGSHVGPHHSSDATHARHRHSPPAWAASRAPKWPRDEEPLPHSSSRLESCRCPKDFQPRQADGTCTCECFDRQQECLHLKRGTRYFTYQDKICIEKRHCQAPLCEFGPYLRESGRCARKDEFGSWGRPVAHRDTFH